MYGLLETVEDPDLRLHHRSQMEAAGLQRILALCRTFGIENVDKQIKILEDKLAEDEEWLRQRLDREILRDLKNPQDVFDAVFSSSAHS